MIYNLSDNIFISTGALAGKNPLKLRQHDNRLWAVCDDGSLVFSDNGDATTWDALNVILLPNREPIVDFLPVQGGVILTHRGGAYAMYGSGTYQDTSILPIQSGAAPGSQILLSDSAVVVDNVAYVLGNRGIYQVTLNGIAEIPQDQTAYFSANYPAWNAVSGAVQGVYLYRFHSILYLFQSGYNSTGFTFNIKTGAFYKIQHTLPQALPYMSEIFNANTDFLLGSGDGTSICRSVYPAEILTGQRLSTLQTRHEDAESMREKIWRQLSIVAEEYTPFVLIRAFVDFSTTAIFIRDGVVDLAEGDNIIDLFTEDGDLIRGKAISFEITIGGNVYLVDDDTGEVLMSGVDPLMDDADPTYPAKFAIREVRVKWREVGPNR